MFRSSKGIGHQSKKEEKFSAKKGMPSFNYLNTFNSRKSSQLAQMVS